MKRGSLTISLCVSFPTTDSDNISILSSVVILCFSSLFPKILTYNRKVKNQLSPKVEDCGLPDDVCVEVLCRLPPKDMVRFKLVSKSWNLLISDICIPKITSPLYGLFVPSGFPLGTNGGDPKTPPIWDFACCVDGTGINNNGISFVESCFRTLPFTPSPYFFLNSCNGFLLLFDTRSFCFYVCNPSTEEYIALPRAPENHIPRAASLTFTPHLNVVWLLGNPFRLVIYCSDIRRWVVHRGLHVVSSKPGASCSSRGVLIHGVLYFLPTFRHILALDTQRITARAIRLPNVVNAKGANDTGCIGLSDNRLHFAWVDHNTHQLFVWMLNETTQWVLKHSFSRLDLTKYSVPGISENLAPYSFHPTSDVLFLGHETGIFRYDPVSKKLDCVYRLKNGTSISYGQNLVHPFTRSLKTMSAVIPSIQTKPRGMKKSAARATT